MFECFCPDLFVKNIQDIDLDVLLKRNIKGLILDIENTLVPTYMKEADKDVIKWIKFVKKSGFKICIVSNASKSRVKKFNEKLKLFAVYRATKPITRGFEKAKRLMKLSNKEIAVIGDQVFTDILGGNIKGMYTVLVKPIHEAESIFVKMRRWPEKYILKKYKEKLGMG